MVRQRAIQHIRTYHTYNEYCCVPFRFDRVIECASSFNELCRFFFFFSCCVKKTKIEQRKNWDTTKFSSRSCHWKNDTVTWRKKNDGWNVMSTRPRPSSWADVNHLSLSIELRAGVRRCCFCVYFFLPNFIFGDFFQGGILLRALETMYTNMYEYAIGTSGYPAIVLAGPLSPHAIHTRTLHFRIEIWQFFKLGFYLRR